MLSKTLSDEAAPRPKKRNASTPQARENQCPKRVKESHSRRDQECNCDELPRRVFKNFRSACQHYGFPGSHQVGSYGPKGHGIVRSYSNAIPHKDKVLANGDVVLYRLKKHNDALRSQFLINLKESKKVRVFRKVNNGVMDLGMFHVNGIVAAKSSDKIEKFGDEFIEFVR